MPYQSNVDQIQVANSTTYADLLGLHLGLDRLQGESATDYLKRLETAARLRREHPYEGALNEMNLQLGFEPKPYISIIGFSPAQIITASIAGVKVGTHPIVPVLEFDNDSMWRWRLLSEVVADLNSLSVPAVLLVDDGPAFQIARQSNSLWEFAESVSGVQAQLTRTDGVVVGSERFNQTVPAYTLTAAGLLTFSFEPPAGTKVTYNFISQPYDIVGAPVSMIGFKDSEFVQVANAPDGSLAYQIREFVQAIMRIDRSYWAK